MAKNHKLTTEQEAELVRRLHSWYEQDVSGTNSVDSSEYYEMQQMYLNEQDREAGEDWASDVRANLWFIMVERLKSKLTEGRPTASFTPRGGRARRFIGRLMEEVWRQDWRDQGMQRNLKDGVEDNSFAGVSWWKIIYNEKTGRLECVTFEPEDIVPQDGAKNIDKSGRIHCLYWLDVSQIKEKFGLTNEEIGSYEIVKEAYADRLAKKRQSGLMLESFDETSLGISFPSSDDHRRILVDEVWYLDDEEETYDEPILDEMGKPQVDEETWKTKVEKKKRPKYPHGRITTITSKRVLADGPNDLDLSPVGLRWPFVDVVAIKRARKIKGVCLGKQIQTLQDSFNDTLSINMDVYRLTGNPQMVIEGHPGWDVDSMENGPGIVYQVRKGTKMEWMKQPTIPPYVTGMQQLFLFLFDTVGGQQDVTAGRRSMGQTDTSSGLRQMIVQAESNLRMWAENMEEAIHRMALIASVIYAKKYTKKMIARIVGPEAQEMLDAAAEYYKEFDSMKGTDGFANMKPFASVRLGDTEMGPDGKAVSASFEIDPAAAGLFDVEIVPDSSLPFTKGQREQMADQAFMSGKLDRITAIEMSMLPEGIKQEAIKRAQIEMEREAQMAQVGQNPALQKIATQVKRGQGREAKQPASPEQQFGNAITP